MLLTSSVNPLVLLPEGCYLLFIRLWFHIPTPLSAQLIQEVHTSSPQKVIVLPLAPIQWVVP